MANRGGQTLFAPHASLEEKRRAFFKDYCVECHNEQKQKGKLRLDNISFALDSVENADRWQKILNQINPGEMPLARPATIPRARVAEMGPKGNSSMDFGSRRPLLADVDADPKLRYRRPFMESLKPRSYQVKPGETLDTIAVREGFKDWRDIYDSPANDLLRTLRPSPNQLRAGDKLVIPATPAAVRSVMLERQAALVRLRREIDNLFVQIEADMDANIRGHEKAASRVDDLKDDLKTVYDIFFGLGKLVRNGVKAMRLSGSALEHANKELAWEALEFAYEPFKEPALRWAANKLGIKVDIVDLVGKATTEAWVNIQTPSFWAGVVVNLKNGKSWSNAVTTDPSEALKAAREVIERQHKDALGRIDAKIKETQRFVGNLANGSLLTIYNAGSRGCSRYA